MRRALLWGHDREVLAFVGDLAPVERPLWRDVSAAVGIVGERQRLVGGVVFSDYKPQFQTCELSVAGVSSFLVDTRMVRELGAYAFGQLALFRIFARTADSNWRAKRALRALAFRHEGIKAHLFGPGIHASDWRLLQPEWEQRWGQPALREVA